ncbi:hypothetical protein [Nocardia gamkensis]|nr:hypothetical protein [Nocardia gamkensis]NQE68543.1 hypothetical protein [Nocardia gamkensis]
MLGGVHGHWMARGRAQWVFALFEIGGVVRRIGRPGVRGAHGG